MKDEETPDAKAVRREDLIRVQCRRIHRALPIDEHQDCPYCFGDSETIRTCGYASFCDYDQDLDPVSFGFPDAYGRYQQQRPEQV